MMIPADTSPQEFTAAVGAIVCVVWIVMVLAFAAIDTLLARIDSGEQINDQEPRP